MGNNMGGANSKTAKIVKINGEFLKLKLPLKVLDIIKEYPNHILLDSQDFLRYNLRSKPLNPEDELKPRKIYLLVELPKFPDEINSQNPLRKVRSGVLARNNGDLMMKKVSRRTVSDLTMIMTRSTAKDDGGDGRSGGSLKGGYVGPTRLKMRLPKAQVEKIMEESGNDDGEAAKKIVRLCLEEKATVSGGVMKADMVEEKEKEEDEVESHCKDVHGMCSPCYSYRRKYKKLTS
ncbi:uncharacterized protein At1g66480-like [Amaranthus tricolor]|uniref:uncharacterized protein At1g66480-like n=1 Tax=Amaranthus tricolor TaxID=29722 RepID=UPI002582C9D2|nr:uncharacterized protein At1g66480-like [Amaranthus tricolor]